MSNQKLDLRVAFRVEGYYWTAYLAPLGTMEGAMKLGQIALRLITESEDRKQAFMELMVVGMSEMIGDVTGAKITDIEVLAAPEHERAGRA